MRPSRVASLLFEMATSKSSRDTVREAVRDALEAARASQGSAAEATERARLVVGESRKIRYGTAPAEFEDDVAEMWFPHVDEEGVRRANEAFFARLPREYDELFRRYDDFSGSTRPAGNAELPDDPYAFMAMAIASQTPLGVFAQRDAVAGRKVLEIGTQAGEIAKRLAPYAKAWLGVDNSSAALRVARLVSPENTTFLHPAKHVSLAVHHGSVDTVLGRNMFVHEPLDFARELIGFLEPFLVTGGRVFAEFFFPNSDRPREHTYPAPHPPTDEARAVFAYSRANVEALIRNRPLRIVFDDERPLMERRFVVLEKTEHDE